MHCQNGAGCAEHQSGRCSGAGTQTSGCGGKKSQYGELIDICRVLEGLPRHASTHAAGVVISDEPLVEYLPVYRGKKGEVITQFDMKEVEKIGLVKFDFLGLRNLTVIADTLALIEKQKKTVPDLIHLDFQTNPPMNCWPPVIPAVCSSWKVPA